MFSSGEHADNDGKDESKSCQNGDGVDGTGKAHGLASYLTTGTESSQTDSQRKPFLLLQREIEAGEACPRHTMSLKIQPNPGPHKSINDVK